LTGPEGVGVAETAEAVPGKGGNPTPEPEVDPVWPPVESEDALGKGGNPTELLVPAELEEAPGKGGNPAPELSVAADGLWVESEEEGKGGKAGAELSEEALGADRVTLEPAVTWL
jgi:hypothetical protein